MNLAESSLAYKDCRNLMKFNEIHLNQPCSTYVDKNLNFLFYILYCLSSYVMIEEKANKEIGLGTQYSSALSLEKNWLPVVLLLLLLLSG